MGFFNRRGKSEKSDLATLVVQGEDMITQLAEAHMSWGLGSAQRWGLDQTTGIIAFSFADGRTAAAPAQIIGSYNATTSSWVWAWANESILPAMSRDSLIIKEWAEKNGQETIAQPRLEADDAMADRLTAISVRLTRATGFYRGSGTAAVPIITFGPVTLTSATGETSAFEVNLQER